ncbi:trypsin delta-like [Anopheles maculipalpis]|uniref:trypsin delta-like n=1 Tax=Anopheles maculipalpis TaxID=1496333 RepID=UPI0021595343|nr:trypsin delta-like [Anopheles maculipalpis]
MGYIVGSLQVALVFTICCTDSIFAHYPLPLEAVLARVNRVPHSLSLGKEVAAGAGDRGTRIVGGSKTTIEDVPYQVSLRYFNNHICGGSIISHAWILTAAHCLDWYPKNDEISVRAGSTNQSTGGSLHAVFYYHLHERYDPVEFQWDVATIRVQTPIVEGPGRVAISLSSASEWSVDAPVTVAGWGHLIYKGRVVDNLQLVQLDVVSREICNQSWTGYITEDMICAGGLGKDACAGDSGGPAAQGGVQYGIVSWGAIECGNGLPGVFTNIAHPSIRNFIRRTTMV